MAAGDTLRRISPNDQFILDVNGNVVGVKSPNANGSDLRFDPSSVAITGGRSAGLLGLNAINALAAAGDSLVAGAVQGGSPYMQALWRGALPYRSVGNFAVAGTRTDQIASQITSAAAAGASILCINGGVNDIQQSISEATLRANLAANWSAARALGMEPVSIGLPPTNTAGNVPRYVISELWRRLYCRKNNIRHADIWSALATSSGAFQSGMFTDAIHYNSVGAIAAAPRIVSALDPVAGRFPTLLALTDTASDHSSFINNAVSFTDSNADGLANNWNTQGAGGTYTITAATGSEVGNWQKCALTAGTNVGFVGSAVTLASLGWNVGDRLGFGFNLRWTDTAQALAVTANLLGSFANDANPIFQLLGGATGNSIYAYNEFTITGGTTVNVNFTATGTGNFEVNRPMVVNLTQLGFPNGVI